MPARARKVAASEELPPPPPSSARRGKRKQDVVVVEAVVPGTPAVPVKKAAATKTKTAVAASAAAPAAVASSANAAPTLLHRLPPLQRATVLHRPSKVIKSPYLCDIQVDGSDNVELCHTPSLGCMGLIATDSVILVSQSTSSTAKSSHILHHVQQTEPDGTSHLIGTHPMTANVLTKALLEGGHVFPGKPVVELKKEVTMGNSRFDFVATHADGSVTVVETKNVPLAHHFDGTRKEQQACLNASTETLDPYHKKALFPYGYRKKVADPVSPRALKHVQELEAIAQAGGQQACLLFITQRTDVSSVVITNTDPIYREAIAKAAKNGVVLKGFAVRWDGNEAFVHKELVVEFDG